MQKKLNILIVLVLALLTIAVVTTPQRPLLWLKADACGPAKVTGKTIVTDWLGRKQYFLFLRDPGPVKDWPTQTSREIFDAYYIGGTAGYCYHDANDIWYILMPPEE